MKRFTTGLAAVLGCVLAAGAANASGYFTAKAGEQVRVLYPASIYDSSVGPYGPSATIAQADTGTLLQVTNVFKYSEERVVYKVSWQPGTVKMEGGGHATEGFIIAAMVEAANPVVLPPTPAPVFDVYYLGTDDDGNAQWFVYGSCNSEDDAAAAVDDLTAQGFQATYEQEQ